MNIVEFIKSLFAKRNQHVESVKQIDKEIAEVLTKTEPVAKKKAKPKKKKPAKKKVNEPK